MATLQRLPSSSDLHAAPLTSQTSGDLSGAAARALLQTVQNARALVSEYTPAADAFSATCATPRPLSQTSTASQSQAQRGNVLQPARQNGNRPRSAPSDGKHGSRSVRAPTTTPLNGKPARRVPVIPPTPAVPDPLEQLFRKRQPRLTADLLAAAESALQMPPQAKGRAAHRGLWSQSRIPARGQAVSTQLPPDAAAHDYVPSANLQSCPAALPLDAQLPSSNGHQFMSRVAEPASQLTKAGDLSATASAADQRQQLVQAMTRLSAAAQPGNTYDAHSPAILEPPHRGCAGNVSGNLVNELSDPLSCRLGDTAGDAEQPVTGHRGGAEPQKAGAAPAKADLSRYKRILRRNSFGSLSQAASEPEDHPGYQSPACLPPFAASAAKTLHQASSRPPSTATAAEPLHQASAQHEPLPLDPSSQDQPLARGASAQHDTGGLDDQLLQQGRHLAHEVAALQELLNTQHATAEVLPDPPQAAAALGDLIAAAEASLALPLTPAASPLQRGGPNGDRVSVSSSADSCDLAVIADQHSVHDMAGYSADQHSRAANTRAANTHVTPSAIPAPAHQLWLPCSSSVAASTADDDESVLHFAATLSFDRFAHLYEDDSASVLPALHEQASSDQQRVDQAASASQDPDRQGQHGNSATATPPSAREIRHANTCSATSSLPARLFAILPAKSPSKPLVKSATPSPRRAAASAGGSPSKSRNSMPGQSGTAPLWGPRPPSASKARQNIQSPGSVAAQQFSSEQSPRKPNTPAVQKKHFVSTHEGAAVDCPRRAEPLEAVGQPAAVEMESPLQVQQVGTAAGAGCTLGNAAAAATSSSPLQNTFSPTLPAYDLANPRTVTRGDRQQAGGALSERERLLQGQLDAVCDWAESTISELSARNAMMAAKLAAAEKRLATNDW